jgi:hypothetical protein
MEAGCFEWESRIGQTMDVEKVFFVSIVSIIIGLECLPFIKRSNPIKNNQK